MVARKAKADTPSPSDSLSAYDYKTLTTRDKDGRTRSSKGNGDAVQKALLVYVAAGGDLVKVVKANGLQDRLDPAKYDNQGLFRMSLGNSLRGLVRNGTHVTIGDVVVKSLDQRVAVPEAPAAAAKDKKARAKKAA